jgi:hypothetical protein
MTLVGGEGTPGTVTAVTLQFDQRVHRRFIENHWQIIAICFNAEFSIHYAGRCTLILSLAMPKQLSHLPALHHLKTVGTSNYGGSPCVMVLVWGT